MLILGMLGTVAVLFATIWFLGAAPMLFLRLKYDAPNDSGFVRAYFNVYYIGVTAGGVAAALGYAGADRPYAAAGMAAIAFLALAVRRRVIGRMDTLRPQVLERDTGAIARWRRAHVEAMVLNLTNFCAVGWSLANL
jgi:hypothetical protein